MKKIRHLTAEDLEMKVAFKKDGSAKYLIYINSRAAQTLLDETYGPENWNTEFKAVGNLIICRLSVWDEETQRWVYREETGSEGNIEKEKTICSDAFKRCISRLGVIELYSTPNIYLPERNDYYVSQIEINDDRKITHLVISSSQGVAMDWTLGQKVAEPVTKSKEEALKEYCHQKKTEEGINRDELKKFWEFYQPKASGWKGNFDVDRLWQNWMARVA